jgi:hypothetical protein
VAGLQDQRLEHQHMIESRPTASRSVRARYRSFQLAAEQLEIDECIQPFQPVASWAESSLRLKSRDSQRRTISAASGPASNIF